MAKRSPRDNPNSIGNLLLERGLTRAQLERALAFKRDHADVLLGEACVRLGFVERHTLEMVIEKQEALRSNGVAGVVDLATRRTRSASAASIGLVATSLQALEKLG